MEAPGPTVRFLGSAPSSIKVFINLTRLTHLLVSGCSDPAKNEVRSHSTNFLDNFSYNVIVGLSSKLLGEAKSPLKESVIKLLRL